MIELLYRDKFMALDITWANEADSARALNTNENPPRVPVPDSSPPIPQFPTQYVVDNKRIESEQVMDDFDLRKPTKKERLKLAIDNCFKKCNYAEARRFKISSKGLTNLSDARVAWKRYVQKLLLTVDVSWIELQTGPGEVTTAS